ncbi:MAG: TOMM precursor leader peptide-binding protein [Deltaproteobacteria bacterium]|nr:TOMM precursor leader peptide-binding protein [Deltaproteobacteria bacterium]
MAYRPQFKRYFRSTLIPSEGVVLQSEHGHVCLRGPVYSRLAPLLDGQHTVEEIVDGLHGQVSAVEVVYALKLLAQRGYAVDAAPGVPATQAAFWDELNVDPREAIVRLRETPASVITFGNIPPEPFRALLTALGVPISDDGACTVVLTDDYLHEGLNAFNTETLAHEHPWLLVKPVGTEVWIGPLFIPGKTGCWACLAHRLQGARKIDSYLREKAGAVPLSSFSLATLPSTFHTALSIAATETARWIVQGRHEELEGQIVTLNVLSLDKQRHAMVRRPQCPHCGDPSAVTAHQSAPIVLQSCKKIFTSDGGHRSFAPDETWQALKHHISPITGIVGALYPTAPWVGETSFTPSFLSSHNFVHIPREDAFDLAAFEASLKSGSSGKGRDPIQAKVSAMSEAIERYSGTCQGDEARVSARRKDLGTAAILPNACMHYSERQFHNRPQWNASGARSSWVPEPFDEDTEIEWSPVWSLTYDEPRYVPTAYCYYGYSRKHQTWFARADSNGCAAGSSKEEAILQGFMEVVERDNIALWWYNRLQRPAVDLASFSEPYFEQLRDYYDMLHRDLWVLDITSDLPIPTFAALSRRRDGAVEDIIWGFGAHFDARLAILRALTEVNQWLPVVHSGSTEKANTYRAQGQDAVHWWKTATLENQPYLAPDGAATPRVHTDYAQDWSDDLAIDVRTCVSIAAAKKLETLVIDQTRPDTGLHVVKVIVPGLRHFWPRFAPGRLYEVPVRMGWLKHPLTEDRLNPQHIFF